MLFENNDDYYLEMIMNVPGLNYLNNSTNMKDDDTLGFLKGNMFTDEYVPYKNMTYIKPQLNDEREKDLFNIMKYSFMINDYNLYLDLHPEDMAILNKYKESTKMIEKLCNEYEKKYGPLTIMKSNYPTFKWIESPWPWDKKDGKYV